MQKVLNQELKFDGPIWQDVSSELKDLIQGMLQKDQLLRLSIGMVKMHPWVSREL